MVSFQGDILTVHRRSGDTISIEVKPDVGVSALKAINLSDVKPGSYVGAAALTGSDGKMTAASLLVFPDGARSTHEGRYSKSSRKHTGRTKVRTMSNHWCRYPYQK
jgi:hypothetical protein